MTSILRQEINRKNIDLDAARSEEERIMLEDAINWLNSNSTREHQHPRTKATALHVAAAKGYIKVMNILLQAGANPNARDCDDWTPLHAAAHWGEREACEVLAEHGANFDVKTIAGQTVFDVADVELETCLDDIKVRQENRRASMQENEPFDLMANLNSPSAHGKHGGRKNSVTRLSTDDKHLLTKADEIKEAIKLRSASESETEEVDPNKASSGDTEVFHFPARPAPAADAAAPQAPAAEPPTPELQPPARASVVAPHRDRAAPERIIPKEVESRPSAEVVVSAKKEDGKREKEAERRTREEKPVDIKEKLPDKEEKMDTQRAPEKGQGEHAEVKLRKKAAEKPTADSGGAKVPKLDDTAVLAARGDGGLAARRMGTVNNKPVVEDTAQSPATPTSPAKSNAVAKQNSVSVISVNGDAQVAKVKGGTVAVSVSDTSVNRISQKDLPKAPSYQPKPLSPMISTAPSTLQTTTDRSAPQWRLTGRKATGTPPGSPGSMSSGSSQGGFPPSSAAPGVSSGVQRSGSANSPLISMSVHTALPGRAQEMSPPSANIVKFRDSKEASKPQQDNSTSNPPDINTNKLFVEPLPKEKIPKPQMPVMAQVKAFGAMPSLPTMHVAGLTSDTMKQKRLVRQPYSSPQLLAGSLLPIKEVVQPVQLRSFTPPVRKESAEAERKAHSRRARESRRSTQGITLEQVKTASEIVPSKSGSKTPTTDRTDVPSTSSVTPTAPTAVQTSASANSLPKGSAPAFSAGSGAKTASVAAAPVSTSKPFSNSGTPAAPTTTTPATPGKTPRPTSAPAPGPGPAGAYGLNSSRISVAGQPTVVKIAGTPSMGLGERFREVPGTTPTQLAIAGSSHIIKRVDERSAAASSADGTTSNSKEPPSPSLPSWRSSVLHTSHTKSDTPSTTTVTPTPAHLTTTLRAASSERPHSVASVPDSSSSSISPTPPLSSASSNSISPSNKGMIGRARPAVASATELAEAEANDTKGSMALSSAAMRRRSRLNRRSTGPVQMEDIENADEGGEDHLTNGLLPVETTSAVLASNNSVVNAAATRPTTATAASVSRLTTVSLFY